ncbi:MAG: hypothetical protein U1C56_00920 [Candidatus Curtissbacteria bacterium]|nr:hypothetical protein [bacterium]MDZ4209721.1 hypothetical protein [Candidatus Curtissbacteria bacterium]
MLKEIKIFHKTNKRIPLKKEFGSRRIFRTHFGTWNNAIYSAGYKPNQELYSKRTYAQDNHKCDSFAEQIIDDWLSSHGIKHILHKRYPGSKMTADFYIPKDKVFIEYFGLQGVNKKYDNGMTSKLLFIKKNNFELIDLYPNDINTKKLSDKLSVLLYK